MMQNLLFFQMHPLQELYESIDRSLDQVRVQDQALLDLEVESGNS